MEENMCDDAGYSLLMEFYGTQPAAGKAVGVSRQVVWSWRKNGIPLSRALEYERITGKKLKAKKLAPNFKWP